MVVTICLSAWGVDEVSYLRTYLYGYTNVDVVVEDGGGVNYQNFG